MLSLGIVREDEKMETSRSRKSNYRLKLNKENLDNLYAADGSLKLNLVKKVINKMKR